MFDSDVCDTQVVLKEEMEVASMIQSYEGEPSASNHRRPKLQLWDDHLAQ